MKRHKLKKNEIKMLENRDFIRRLLNYTYSDTTERIVTAWIDTNEDNDKETDEKPFSDEFVDICEAIIGAGKEAIGE